jgi:hypothetical protein
MRAPARARIRALYGVASHPAGARPSKCIIIPPSCSQPDPEPDLNAEIMQELAKFQVERSSVDQDL